MDKKGGLLPQLGFFTTLAIVIGAMIGSGIFKKPAYMALNLGSPEIMLGIWLIAGLITLFGALTNAEVAGMFSETGGQYVFFREMYGEATAYLYGWAIFSVMQTGSIASISYVFAEYSTVFFRLPELPQSVWQAWGLHIPFIGTIYPLANLGVKAVTAGLIISLSIVNYYGVKFGGRISAFFTSAKLAAIAALVLLCFFFTDGSWSNLTLDSPRLFTGEINLLGGILIALSGAFWAYDGWNNITFIAGEVKNPQRNIPRALAIGTVAVVAVYIIINMAFLYVMPITEIAGAKLVAASAAEKSLGSWGVLFIALAVMISTFGSSNGSIMASARVYFAMAQKKMFFRQIGFVHPKHHTPANAIILQCVWAVMLVFSGTFDILTDMLIFVSWVFYALGAYGVFVLRKKYPDKPRPYKVWGYPIVPIIFILFASLFVILTLYNDIVAYNTGKSELINSLFGVILVLMGLPLYYFFRKNKKISGED